MSDNKNNGLSAEAKRAAVLKMLAEKKRQARIASADNPLFLLSLIVFCSI